MSASVSIIVVTYNARSWVPRCLETIRSHESEHPLELVVLDNASTDFTPDELRGWAGEGAIVEALDTNVGFGRGCNAAVARSSGDFVVLVNPDALLAAGTVDAMVDFLQTHPGAGIVGGRVTSPEGELDRGSCWGVQTTWSLACFALGLSTAAPRSRWLNPEGLGAWDRDTVGRVGVVTGCLLMLSRQLWDELQGFDDDFFMYGEDADLCMRAAQLGKQSWITPRAEVVHALGASSATLVGKQVLLFTGKASLVIKHHEGFTRRLQLALLLGGVALRALGELVTRTDRAAWRGLWRRRREWQSGWPTTISD